MPKSPDKKDPEGTDSMSDKEYKDRQDTIARDLLNLPKRNDKDPEGTKGSK